MTTLQRHTRFINSHRSIDVYADEVLSALADIGARVLQSDFDFIEEIRGSTQDKEYRHRMLTNVLIDVAGRLRRKEMLENGTENKPWSGIFYDEIGGRYFIRHLSE